jgi:LacI family transcriptional regulator
LTFCKYLIKLGNISGLRLDILINRMSILSMNENVADDSTKITMTDIARESGVSPATVSLVLRDKPGISSATRQRVLDSASALGYIFSPTKTNERPFFSSMGIIFKIQPDDAPHANQFYAPVLSGIESHCRAQNINLFYAQLPVDEQNNPLETPRVLKEQSADGLLFVGIQLNEAVTQVLQKQNQPIVLVDAYAEDEQYDAVVTDNEAGAYRATLHLLQNGHRHVAMVGSMPQGYPSIQERRSGYLRAIKEHGLTPEFVDCYHTIDSATAAAETFLRDNKRVTAVFCANDEVAISLMRVAQSLGINIPQDLSVIGFDNIQLAHLILPALTTMRVDKMGMGRLAGQLLSNRIQYPEAGYVKSVIQPSLIERNSVAKINE